MLEVYPNSLINLNEHKGSTIRIALVLSILLHSLAFILIMKWDHSIEQLTNRKTNKIFNISLTQPHSTNLGPEEVIELESPKPNVAQVQPDLITIKVDETQNLPLSDNSVESPALSRSNRSIAEMVSTFSGQYKNSIRDTSFISPCSLLQKATQIRRCEKNDTQNWDRLGSGTFDKAFKKLSETTFRQDMATLESLRTRREYLNDGTSLGQLDLAIRHEEQREIMQEIRRIEAQYEGQNLIGLIVVGLKVSKIALDKIKEN